MARRTLVILAIPVVVAAAGFGLAYANHVAGLGCAAGSVPRPIHPGTIYAPPPQPANGHLDIAGREPYDRTYRVGVGTVVTLNLPPGNWVNLSDSDSAVLAPQDAVHYCDGSVSRPFRAAERGQARLFISESNKEVDTAIDVTVVVS